MPDKGGGFFTLAWSKPVLNLARVASRGVLWETRLEIPEVRDSPQFSSAVAKAGSLYLHAQAMEGPAIPHAVMMKVSAEGKLEWRAQDPRFDGYGLLMDEDERLYVQSEEHVRAFDNRGSLLWAIDHPIPIGERSSYSVLPAGGLVVLSGRYDQEDSSRRSHSLHLIGADGQHRWNRQFYLEAAGAFSPMGVRATQRRILVAGTYWHEAEKGRRPLKSVLVRAYRTRDGEGEWTKLYRRRLADGEAARDARLSASLNYAPVGSSFAEAAFVGTFSGSKGPLNWAVFGVDETGKPVAPGL